VVVFPNKPPLAILEIRSLPAINFEGLRAEGVGGSENRRKVIIGFHFILMPGSDHDRQDSESPVGVASKERGPRLRGDRDAAR
jgi:hypothetical protein